MCPPPEQLAAAASGEDDESAQHALDCVSCALVIEEQRQLIDLVQRARMAPLGDRRRDALAAEIMAAADLAPRSPIRKGWPIAVGVVAAAACAYLLLAPGHRVDAPAVHAATDERIAEPRSSMVAYE